MPFHTYYTGRECELSLRKGSWSLTVCGWVWLGNITALLCHERMCYYTATTKCSTELSYKDHLLVSP
jgi:hypothetical protein